MGQCCGCLRFTKHLNGKVASQPNANELTHKDLEMIQKHWSIVMRNIDTNGYMLFSKLFQDKNIMAKFDFAVANHLDYKKTLNDARLSIHIRRVFHSFNTVISCIHDKEQTSFMLQDVGAIHAVYGIHIEDLKKFKLALLETLSCLLNDMFTKEAERCWSILIDVVATEFMKGIEKGQPEKWMKENSE